MKKILIWAAMLTATFYGRANAVEEAPATFRVDPAACVIVVPERTNAIVDYAVAELRMHLKLIGGRDVPVRTRPTVGTFPFYVGLRPASDPLPLGAEESRWQVTRKGIWLYGTDRRGEGKGGSKGKGPEDALSGRTQPGTLYAVYEFLENRMGVRWIAPGDAGIAYPPQTPFAFLPGQGTWHPQLVQRHMRTAYKDELRDEAFKGGQVPKDMRFSSAEFDQRQFDEQVWQRRMRMGSTVDFTYGHAFRKWWAKYGNTHPEYFALGKNGERGPESPKTADRVKMCVSNENLVKQIVKDHFAAHGGLVVNACENDSRNFCRCPECMALDVRLPGEEKLDVDDLVLTDRYVHFTNAVLEEAKRYNPKAQTVFYAYSRYNYPPRRERLDDGVILFLLPNLAMTDRELTDYYVAWKNANAKETFLRPNDLDQDTGLPLGFEEHMFTKYKLADKYLSLKGTDYDTCWGFWPVSGITNYIMARGFYRPERSFADWETEYCQAFGPAQDDIKAYYRYWRQIWNDRVMPHLDQINGETAALKLLRNKMANLPGQLYSEADFDRTDALLQRALTKNLAANENARVRELVLANQHNRLTYRATKANCVASNAPAAEQKQATQALYDFRRAHRLDLNMNWEQLFYLENAYEDNAGFERLLGTETTKMRAYRLELEKEVRAARAGAAKNKLAANAE